MFGNVRARIADKLISDKYVKFAILYRIVELLGGISALVAETVARAEND